MSVKALRSVRHFYIVKRKLRLKPVRGRERVSPFDYNSFSSPRSLALGVRLYAFGSRAGILHSSAFAAASAEERGVGYAQAAFCGFKNAASPVSLAFGERGRSLFRAEKVFSKSIDKTPLALL